MSRYEITGAEEIAFGPNIQNPALPRLMSGIALPGAVASAVTKKMAVSSASPAIKAAMKARLKAYSRALRGQAKAGKITLAILDRYAQLAHKVKHPRLPAHHWKKRAIHKLRQIAHQHRKKLSIGGYDFVGQGLQPPEMENLKRLTTDRGMGHLNKGATIMAQLYGAEQAAKTLEMMAASIRTGGLR
jgi:hypothetical protein